MGLFGNKDNKIGEGQQIDSRPTEVAVAQTIDSKATDAKIGLNAWIQSVKVTYREWKSKSCEVFDSPQLNELRQQKRQFERNFCHPIGDIYRSMPQDITELKATTFGDYSYRERLFGLEALTLLTAIVTLRSRNNITAPKRFMLAVRNSSLTYLLGGLLLAPEIYNPLIRSDF